MDTAERALYNTVLSGIAQDGKSFFYVNPLEAVPDVCLFVGGGAEAKDLKAGDIANFDIDLVGCKKFVKLTVSGDAAGEGASCSVVLGDPAQAPV